MKELAMLLPLRRPLKNSATYCAFETFVEKTTNEKWFLEQLPFLRKEGARISED
jgi:hypothetical protein